MLWGINGATSVCASVLGVAISLVHGIGSVFAIGAPFYVAAGRRIVPSDEIDGWTDAARSDACRGGPTHVAPQKFNAT